MDTPITTIFNKILTGDSRGITKAIQAELGQGIDPVRILNESMIGAMAEVGRRFETGEYFVPDMLYSARAMQLGLEKLKPHLAEAKVKPVGKVVIGTVQGDIHDIGKNLVAIMLEGNGFEILDLGVDVAPATFVAAVQREAPQIVALSALLSTSMPGMGITIHALEKAGLRDQVKVIVGGAPVTENYAELIGADGYAPDACRAVGLAKQFIKTVRR